MQLFIHTSAASVSHRCMENITYDVAGFGVNIHAHAELSTYDKEFCAGVREVNGISYNPQSLFWALRAKEA